MKKNFLLFLIGKLVCFYSLFENTPVTDVSSVFDISVYTDHTDMLRILFTEEKKSCDKQKCFIQFSVRIGTHLFGSW